MPAKNSIIGTIVWAVLSLPLIGGNLSAQKLVELPLPTGPLGVGRTTFDWVDPSRTEVMTDRKDDNRELVVYLFYPIDTRVGTTPAEYFPHQKEIEVFEEQFGKDFFKTSYGRSYTAITNMRTHTFENTKIAAGSHYPVLIFSHGGGIPVLFYTALIEDLVSHGYIVAAVEHSYDGATVVRPGGHIITQSGWDQDPQRTEAEKTDFHMSRYEAGAADNSFVLDQLIKLNRGSLPNASKSFKGKLDTRRVGALGHSLGGMISIMSCRHDKRFGVCLNLDGGLDEGQTYGSPVQQVAAMYGGGKILQRPGETAGSFEKRKASNNKYWERLRAPYAGTTDSSFLILLDSPGFSHFSYFDLPTAQSETGPWAATTEDFIRNKTLIRVCTLWAFDRGGRAKDRRSFKDLAKQYPEVSIEPMKVRE